MRLKDKKAVSLLNNIRFHISCIDEYIIFEIKIRVYKEYEMINKKYYGIVMSCLAAIFITIPVSLVMTIINVGFTKDFFMIFIKSSLAGTLISVPLANIGVPAAEKIAKRIVKK